MRAIIAKIPYRALSPEQIATIEHSQELEIVLDSATEELLILRGQTNLEAFTEAIKNAIPPTPPYSTLPPVL
jgi:hypothetical protein